MKITGETGLGKVLKNILKVCLYVGIFILIALPFLLKIAGVNINASAIVIYPNGTVMLMIVYKFIKLFESLQKNNPFRDDNVKILRQTAKLSLLEALFWLIDTLYEIILVKYFDVVILVILVFLIVLFFGVSIALYILSELFRQATEYKKENELTI